MKLHIMTLEKAFLQDCEVEEVIIPGEKGYLGILKEHAPLIALLGIGILKYRKEGEKERALYYNKMFVSGGYVQLSAQQDVVVLANEVKVKEQVQSKKELTEHLALALSQLKKNLNISPKKTLELQEQVKKYRSLLEL